jgi:hypothetical protein
VLAALLDFAVTALTATDAHVFVKYLFRGQHLEDLASNVRDSHEDRESCLVTASQPDSTLLLTPFVQVGVGVSRRPIGDKTVRGFSPSSHEVT